MFNLPLSVLLTAKRSLCSISKEVIMSTLSNFCGGMEKDNPLLRSTVSSSVNCLDDMLITTLLVSSELTA